MEWISKRSGLAYLNVFIISAFLFIKDVTAQFIKQEGVTDISSMDSLLIQRKIDDLRKLPPEFSDSVQVIYLDLLYKSMQIKYKSGVIHLFLLLGNIASKDQDYDRAIYNFLTGIRYCDTFQHRKMLALFYNNLGNVYNKQSKFIMAYTAYDLAAKHSQFSNLSLANTYSNAATVLGQLKQYNKSLLYINRALSIAVENKSYELWSVLLLNKGRCYYEMKDYEQSAHYIDSSILMSRTFNDKRYLASGLIESARVDIAKGNPENSLAKLQESLELSMRKGMPGDKKIEAFSTIGNAFLQLKRYKKAEDYFLQALNLSEDNLKEQIFIQDRLSDLYFATSDFKKAYLFHKNYSQLKDSLQSKEVALSVNDLETKYRTLEKDQEIISSHLKISNQQKKIAEKNTWIFGISGLATLLIILVLWRYFYLRQKNKKLQSEQEVKYLKAVMEGEEKERIRIANELHDGIVSELTTVKMNLNSIGINETAKVKSYNESLVQLSMIINDVRNTAHNLMPEILLRYDLSQAVELLCSTIQKTGRLEIEFQKYGDFQQLSMKIRHAVYRIIQELLHNIIKHTKATNALVQLSCYENLLTITMENNGLQNDWLKKKHNKGMGLRNVEQRVKNFNGQIHWNYDKNNNLHTSVYIEFDV